MQLGYDTANPAGSYHIARDAAQGRARVFADIGPIMEQKNVSVAAQYQRIADVFLEEGADCFLFETFLNTMSCGL